MKHFFAIILMLCLLVFTGSCAGQSVRAPDSDTARKISVVCTYFPQYDWVRQISDNDDLELTLLQSGGADLHNFQPSVSDIVKISECDLFIYIGGESDEWVKDALAQAVNKDMTVLNLLETLGEAALEEEITEGMTAEHEHEGEHEGEESALDEHIWLSLRNAQILCTAIADALILLDDENAAQYSENLSEYINKLESLDAQYKQAFGMMTDKTLVFGDRFPFRYLLEDYAIEYYAAFPGCSAETEAGFDTIVFLSKKVDELDLGAVMVTESSNQAIASTIISSTSDANRKILVLDSMQSVTADDIYNGRSYLSVMAENLAVLKKALA